MARLLLTTIRGSFVVSVEIAASADDKAMGLSFRRELPPDCGMLFVYDRPEQVAITMRDTLLPLDVVFLHGNRVRRIVPWTPPRSLELIDSREPVTAVLELPGGTSHVIDLRPGDRVVRF